MKEETKSKVEEKEEELDLEELDQVAGGAMNNVHVNRTQDITDSMKQRV